MVRVLLVSLFTLGATFGKGDDVPHLKNIFPSLGDFSPKETVEGGLLEMGKAIHGQKVKLASLISNRDSLPRALAWTRELQQKPDDTNTKGDPRVSKTPSHSPEDWSEDWSEDYDYPMQNETDTTSFYELLEMVGLEHCADDMMTKWERFTIGNAVGMMYEMTGITSASRIDKATIQKWKQSVGEITDGLKNTNVDEAFKYALKHMFGLTPQMRIPQIKIAKWKKSITTILDNLKTTTPNDVFEHIWKMTSVRPEMGLPTHLLTNWENTVNKAMGLLNRKSIGDSVQGFFDLVGLKRNAKIIETVMRMDIGGMINRGMTYFMGFTFGDMFDYVMGVAERVFMWVNAMLDYYAGFTLQDVATLVMNTFTKAFSFVSYEVMERYAGFTLEAVLGKAWEMNTYMMGKMSIHLNEFGECAIQKYENVTFDHLVHAAYNMVGISPEMEFPKEIVKEYNRTLHDLIDTAGDMRVQNLVMEFYEMSGLTQDSTLPPQMLEEAKMTVTYVIDNFASRTVNEILQMFYKANGLDPNMPIMDPNYATYIKIELYGIMDTYGEYSAGEAVDELMEMTGMSMDTPFSVLFADNGDDDYNYQDDEGYDDYISESRYPTSSPTEAMPCLMIGKPVKFKLNGECSYEAFVKFIAYRLSNTPRCVQQDPVEEVRLLLDASSEDMEDAKNRLDRACYDAVMKKSQKNVPFGAASSGGDAFDEEFFNGGTIWNEGKDGSIRKAAKGVEQLSKRLKTKGIEFPDYLPNFQNCQLNAVTCCWVDAQNAKSEPMDNTDVCYVDLGKSNSSSHVDGGFGVFPGEEEGKTNCHGFAWGDDASSTSHRYRGNTLFHVAMAENFYGKGYVRNIPGAPLCGCVEKMPVVTRADCSEPVVSEKYEVVYNPDKPHSMFVKLASSKIGHKSCRGADGNFNDLSSHYERLVRDGHAWEGHKKTLDGILVGEGNCTTAVNGFMKEKGWRKVKK